MVFSMVFTAFRAALPVFADLDRGSVPELAVGVCAAGAGEEKRRHGRPLARFFFNREVAQIRYW